MLKTVVTSTWNKELFLTKRDLLENLEYKNYGLQMYQFISSSTEIKVHCQKKTTDIIIAILLIIGW